MKKSLLLLSVFFAFGAMAQKDTTNSAIKLSAYIETYYIYDFGNPANHKRPNFISSFHRHNEVNLNLAYLKASYEKTNVRANIGFMSGTYANANLSNEPGVLRNILEANTGIKISRNKNLWIDFGVFPSHIGFESAIGSENWTLTRSILADNSPYFESGAKISFISNDKKWLLSGLVLNGWQRIQRVHGNQTPAFGHQVTFTPNNKITLNSSSFIGNDFPDQKKRMRYFHNFYSIFQLGERYSLVTGFDIGLERESTGSTKYNLWYSPVIIMKVRITEKLFLSARTEYFYDPNEVIISTKTARGFQTFGYSLNVDYLIAEKILWRMEGRMFNSRDRIFFSDNVRVGYNYFVGTSLAISF